MIGMNSGQAMVSVGVAMILQDQFTNQANNIGKAYRDMMEEIYQSSGASRGLTEMVWSRGATAGALTVMGGLIDSYTYFADVQNDLFWATKMTNGGLEEQQALMERVREVNLVTPLTNKDLSSAARFMAMAGNTNEAIQRMLEPVAQLSGVFGMQAGGKGGVADLFTNISMMFGRNLEDQQEAYNVANELYAVTTSSNTNLQDLAQAITYSGSEMRRAGYGLRETAASIGAMGNYGIQGSAAGTALANMMRYIQLSASGQKAKGSDMLKAVGIDAKSLMDSEGHLISLNDIYHKMYEATKDLDTFSKNSFFYNVFGVRGTREIAAMVQMIEDAAGGASKYEEIMQRMQDATGNNELGKAYGEWTEGPAGQLAMFKAELDNLRTTVGEQIAPLFTPILHHLNSIMSMVGWLGNTGLGGAAIRAVAIGTAFQLILRVLTAIRGAIRIATVDITQMSSAGGRMSAGPAAANVQLAIMEGHMRTLMALTAQYMAIQSKIPKGGIFLGSGVTMFGKGGKVSYERMRANGHINRYTQAEWMALQGRAASMAGAAGAAAAGAAGGAAVARGLGSRIIGFLGGPWGVGLSMGIPFLIDLLTSNNEENRKQTELLEESLSTNELKNLEDEALINALRAACKEGIMDGVSNAKPVPVDVTVEGGGNYTNISMGGNDFNIFE